MKEQKSYRVEFRDDPRVPFQIVYTHKPEVIARIISRFRFVNIESIIFNDYAES